MPDDASDRPLGPALRCGWRNRCPNCGRGRILHSYVKVHDKCSSCGEDLHLARADDGPAYLTILIVGHIVAPLLLIVFETFRPEPLVLFGIPIGDPPRIGLPIEIRGLLSFLAFGDFDAEVRGINEFPRDEWPPLLLTFVSFHNMVLLGQYFIVAMAFGLFLQWRGKLWTCRWYLKTLVLSIPLPICACELGWMAAEIGRQQWTGVSIGVPVQTIPE